MEKQVKIKKWLQGIDGMIILEIVAVCIMLIPVFIISFYTIPSADDFVNSVTIRADLLEHHSYLSAAFNEVIYYYKNISGYFFGAFLNFYVSPLLRGGIKALRITVFFLNLFFYSSLYFFVDELLNFFYGVKNKKINLLVYILILFAFINNQYNSEMTTWYCTLISYVFVVSCMFWGIIFFLKALKSGKSYYVVLASLLGFLASGDALNVTALNCGIYLLISYIGFSVYKKRKIPLICFGSALTGGIINAVAPGNFIRQGHNINPYPIMEAINVANYHGKQQIKELLFYSPFIILLFVFFIIMLKIIRNTRSLRIWHLIIFAGIIIAGIIVVNFPVCLGYRGSHFPERCVWVENCVIYLGGFSWTACLAEWIKNRHISLKIQKGIIRCVYISIIFYALSLSTRRNITVYPTIDMIKQLADNELTDYVEFWEEILKEIEYSEEDDVQIYRKEIKKNAFVRYPDLTSDKDYEMNKAIAEYYGKASVVMITDEED